MTAPPGRAAPRPWHAALLLIVLLVACGEPPPAADEAAPSCSPEGMLTAELYGAVPAKLDWRPGQLQCQGMPRPNGAGARLRFAGPAGIADATTHLAIILGLPALERGKTGRELPTNVTVMQIDEGRFFATQDTAGCWSDIERQDRLQSGDRYLIAGVLYCMAPLPELRGDASVRLSEVHFVGVLDWQAAL